MCKNSPDQSDQNLVATLDSPDQATDGLADSTANDQAPPTYELCVSDDKFHILLDCPSVMDDLENTCTKIVMDLQQMDLPRFPTEDQVADILTTACADHKHLRNFRLASGTEVIPAQDGKLDWTEDYFAEGFVTDEETGAVNFREKVDNLSVKEGELLVRLHPAIEGVSGMTVFGTDVSVGKPEKVGLRCGKGVNTVEEDDGTTAYYAATAGRIRFTDGTVAVDDIYVIKGNVGLESGNIHHTGAVVIEGDVTTGAVIEAEGDIQVKGMVEPSDITCGGSLDVAGGLLGSEGHRVRVSGGIKAKYISEADIEALDNVEVINEIAHAQVRTRGRVLVPKGRIVGGLTVARQGIKLGSAGAGGSSDTVLVAGFDYTLERKLAENKSRRAKLTEAQQKIQAALTAADGHRDDLPETDKKIMDGLSAKIEQAAQALEEVEQCIQEATNEAMAGAVEEVVILEEVWSGTTVQLGEHKTRVRSSIHKPRIAQRRRDKVRILPLGEGNMPQE